MLAYIIRRVAQSFLVLLIVGLVAFSMFQFVGDPVDNMLGQERTQADVERLRAELGLDQPFLVQYWKFLEQAVQGNFGLSYRQGRPVSEILLERAPATLELAFVSGLLALAGGIGLGIFTAIRRSGVAANVINFVPDLIRREIAGADHWVAHQRPDEVARMILDWMQGR